MNKVNELKQELKSKLISYLENKKSIVKKDKSMRPMDVMPLTADEIGLSINVLYSFIRDKEGDFRVSTLSKICDFLDK